MTLQPLEGTFQAQLKQRLLLSHKDSEKATYHLVLDLKGSGIQYSVGDCLGIYPQNDPKDVQAILSSLKAKGTERVWNKKRSAVFSLQDFLLKHANLSKVTRAFLTLLAENYPDPKKLNWLEQLLANVYRDKCKIFIEAHTLPLLARKFTFRCLQLQSFCDSLLPMLPRFYSIASAQDIVGEEAHLTVGITRYQAQGNTKIGVCSHYLCNLTEVNSTIPLFHHPATHFSLSEESMKQPLIMIGPGTGIAPFRGFMQERMKHNSLQNWLFFGEWNQNHHFYYKPFWHELTKKGALRLSLAFSRDQKEKYYVQHKMQEHGEELFSWIQKKAYIYVCGDAKKMAKAVDKTLCDIIQKYGNFNVIQAKNYLKQLKEQKRYCRDVY